MRSVAHGIVRRNGVQAMLVGGSDSLRRRNGLSKIQRVSIFINAIRFFGAFIFSSSQVAAAQGNALAASKLDEVAGQHRASHCSTGLCLWIFIFFFLLSSEVGEMIWGLFLSVNAAIGR